MGSKFPTAHAKWSLVFQSFAPSSQRVNTALNLVYNIKYIRLVALVTNTVLINKMTMYNEFLEMYPFCFAMIIVTVCFLTVTANAV